MFMNIEAATEQVEIVTEEKVATEQVETATEEKVATEQVPASQSSPPQDMDGYLTNGYDYKVPRRGDIITGTIIEANERGLVVDIGFKREGFIYNDDLDRLDEETRSEIHPGVEIPVFVIRSQNREGQPILSIYQARLQKDWLRAEEMMASGQIYEGEIAGHNRGGLIVKFGKIRGFIPASQVAGLPRRLPEEERRQRLSGMTGEQVGLKIIEVDRRRRRLIFSQRQALRSWQEVQRERVIDGLTEGETRHGTVTSITNFGAFVDLGGADGLIHVSELSWGRVDNPRQVLKVGDEVDVYVLDLDRKRKRIALSLKRLQPDPWTLVDEHYRVGQLVEGRITRVLDFGVFISLALGVEGLLHASEMIGTPELRPSEIVRPGETLLVKIIRIDSRKRRLALSAKQVRRNEWERWVAEQQAARETEREAEEAAAQAKAAAIEAEKAAMVEAAEAKAAAIEAAVMVSKAVEAEDLAIEAEEVAIIEADEAEAATIAAEIAAGEAAEAKAAAIEAETVAIREAAEAEAAAIEAEAAAVSEMVGAEDAAAKAETAVSEADEAQIAAIEADIAVGAADEASAGVSETAEEETAAA